MVVTCPTVRLHPAIVAQAEMVGGRWMNGPRRRAVCAGRPVRHGSGR
jgi:hypothetical protein